jgi:hypothetical protein
MIVYLKLNIFDLQIVAAEKKLRIPSGIERNVLKQNVEFMHIKSHFSMEYFQFVKKVMHTNLQHVQIAQGAPVVSFIFNLEVTTLCEI